MVRDRGLALQDRDTTTNTVLREYVRGPGMGGGIGGLLSMRQNGEDYFYLYDGKGNVTTVLDSSQTVVALYRYDAFGRLINKTALIDQPYRFSTKRYDAGTGLSCYGYRFYSPAVARWLTRDSLLPGLPHLEAMRRCRDLRSNTRTLSPHATGLTPGPAQVLMPFASLRTLAFSIIVDELSPI